MASQARRYKAGSVDCALRDALADSLFQEFMDKGLIGLVLFGSEAAEFGQHARGNANRDELLGVAGRRTADAARTLKLLIRHFRDVDQV
jgi:hypothetical protein